MAKSDELQAWIEHQRDELQRIGERAARRYWGDHAEQVRRGEKPLHGIVIRRKGGVHIEWYKMIFKRKSGGGWAAFKKSLPRHGGYRYTAREFSKDLTPAERQAIEVMEDVAEKIRRQNEKITEVAYRARECAKRQNQLLAELGEDDEG